MKCRTVKILLQELIDGNLAGADTGLIKTHLQECAACREDHRQTLNMIEMLKEIPVLPASAGFTERALSNAVRSRPATAGSRFKYLGGGIAASLLAVFLMVSTMAGLGPERSAADVVLIDGQVKTIRVAIESARVIDEIEMTIDVSENLEIEGYRGQQAISWTTRLEPGVNLITLPVTAIAAGDGEIVARVGLGKSEKIYRIRTLHRPAGSAGGDVPVLASIAGTAREARL